jgi:hypothetical protein
VPMVCFVIVRRTDRSFRARDLLSIMNPQISFGVDTKRTFGAWGKPVEREISKNL